MLRNSGGRVYRTFSNPNYWFKKALRGFETIRQGSTFDNSIKINPWRLQSNFSKVIEKGFPNSDHWTKIMFQKVAGAYIEPYKIQTIDPNRSKENLT